MKSHQKEPIFTGFWPLANVSQETALRTELTPEFPGVDIDAVYKKLRGEQRATVKKT